MLDKMNRSVVDNDLLEEHEAERKQLRAQLEKFLAWNKKWPGSHTIASIQSVINAEIELDDIMTETQELLKCP